MSRWLAAAIAAVLVAACGSAASTGAPARPSSTPAVVLTQADSGRTVQLAVGQEAQLQLPSRYTWSDPRPGSDAVTVTRAGPAPGFQVWTIAAVASGTARITASGRPACSPGQLCPDVLLAFSVTVAVT